MFRNLPIIAHGSRSARCRQLTTMAWCCSSQVLLPADKRQRARAITWSFAALNSIEPPLQELGLLNFLWANEDWAIQRRPILEAFVNQRLNDLSASLGNREYLEDRFTGADLLMTTVLRIPRQQPI